MTEISASIKAKVEGWLQDPSVDEATKQELRSLENDPKELEDRFYRDLEFGTGGLRGVIGAGSSRMNRYTVARATQGFAKYILEAHAGKEGNPSVVIAHDCRHFSPEFALEAALVLAGNGIVAKLFPSLRPTPQLSFSVRALNATGGLSLRPAITRRNTTGTRCTTLRAVNWCRMKRNASSRTFRKSARLRR